MTIDITFEVGTDPDMNTVFAQNKVSAAMDVTLPITKGIEEIIETLFIAQLELSGLKRNYFNAYVKLYKALGGGWLGEADANATPGN